MEDITSKMIYAIENYDDILHNNNINLKKFIDDEFAPLKYAKMVAEELIKLFSK